MFTDALPLAKSSTSAKAGRPPLRLIILLFFVFAALNGAFQKSVTRGFDEVAHISYVAHVQATGFAWPRLEAMRLLTSDRFLFSDTATYLNHPPFYYWLVGALGPSVEGHPSALIYLRLINVVIASIGFAALLALSRHKKMSKIEEYAWLIPLFATPVLAPLAGSVNNDNLAFAGGAVALLALHRFLTTGSSRWFAATLTALIIASIVKLTALMLVGGLVLGALAVRFWRGALKKSQLLAAIAALMIGALPYFIFWVQYGGLVPETPGQIALLQSTTPEGYTWENAPRLAFGAYALKFALTFIAQWVPSLQDRNTLQYALLVAPIFAIGCALVGATISARRLARREETADDILIVAGLASIAFALLCHLFFSYRHHVAYAYILDAYPRYYLPLAAIVPLAGLSLLAAMREQAVRSVIAGALIGGPVLLALFGAP